MICQQVKPVNHKKYGLLLPLPIPLEVWQDLSMDFITHLPQVQNKIVILVILDRQSKYAHFGALPSNFNTVMVANLFIDMVVKLHGIPRSIVFDRDRVFTSKFWKELHKKSGTTINLTSAYHPQSDGQTEVLNRSLEQYLR